MSAQAPDAPRCTTSPGWSEMPSTSCVWQMTSHSLLTWLGHHARSSPHDIFLASLATERTVSFAEAYNQAVAITATLRVKGLGPGDVVSLCTAPNHPIFIPLLAACAASGLSLLPLDPALHPNELSLALNTVNPRLVIAGRSALTQQRSAQDVTVAEFLDELPTADAAPTRGAPRDVTEPCLLIYTSGSSGRAKIVSLTESALVANASRIMDRYSITSHDRMYCVLPYHHMNATMVTGCVPLLAGAATVLGPMFDANSARTFWRDAALNDISILSLVPPIMRALLTLGGPRAELRNLRFAFCGAAPLDSSLWETFENTFQLPVYQGYGLTETTCWAVSTPPSHDRDYRAVGIPLPDCEVDVVSSTTSESQIRAVGDHAKPTDIATWNPHSPEIGEVLIRGPIVMAGYYRDRRLTDKTVREDGFLRTGDLGFIDSAGQLHIVGRKKELIIKNGRNIVPDDIDSVLSTHPDVLEAKTVGIAHALVGEQIVSAVRLAPHAGATTADLRRFARANLTSYKCPDRFVVVGVIPRTSTGKVAVGELRKRLTGEAVDARIKLLNSWKYKRAQPSDVDGLRAALTRASLFGEDISFVTYWGCGTRSRINDIDRAAMDRMAEYIVQAALPPAATRLVLVLTDIHAQLNCKPLARVEDYFAAVAGEAAARGFSTVYLSALWASVGRSLESLQPASDSHYLVEVAVARAAKHAECDDVTMAARQYIAACEVDSEAMSACFPRSIFLTYNGPRDSGFLPRLPTLYIYSYKKVSRKPWFSS